MLSLRIVGGGILGGKLERDGERFDVMPGFLIALNVARRFIGGGENDWFLAGSLTVGVSSTRTTSASGATESLIAQDTRLAVLFGRSFDGRWNPYVAIRGFGGPVKWTLGGTDVVGSDRHHYAVGLGGSFALGRGFDLNAEGAFFGERSLSGGVSYSF